MKLYFAKYLPVEGEVKKRTGTTVSDEVGKCLRENDNGYDYYQKVTLFLCSNEIEVNDEIFNELLEKGTYSAVNKHDPEFIEFRDKDGLFSYHYKSDCFKVIGEILTPGIIENQKFTEKETEFLTIGENIS